MTSPKKALANQQNSKKSTGPKTPQGKANSSSNSVRHGILAAQLLLGDESPTDFQLLLDGLRASLRPAGTLEQALVEKIAVSLWRQRRLIRAETAGIELAARLEVKGNRHQVEVAMGIIYPQQLTNDDLEPSFGGGDDDHKYFELCSRMVDEYSLVQQRAITDIDVSFLAHAAPTLHGLLVDEASVDGVPIGTYLERNTDGLLDWVDGTVKCCREAMAKMRRHAEIAEVAALVRSHRSAPVDQDLLCRYQTALDRELYRAIEALREAQEWRVKTFDSDITTVAQQLAPGA
ncbi:hypothetical protein LMG31506_05454 [Cupriavidus yeoncheonensis]|uniref:Uncharacterized protein n=1 Tax=Cupriavidus yeoncheonensis TaxID=1462994 RepID=A0A916IZT3_9BURK|nr:hypothetical protein [Cupriavidus yeoncheonensis]CAG2155562.1 hypothetical protein LMG31506_05454 [Cupriavidus yeoncheonensis]